MPDVAVLTVVIVSFKTLPETIPELVTDDKLNSPTASKLPPIISPPDIVMEPFSFNVALSPAFCNPVNISARVLFAFKLIVCV